MKLANNISPDIHLVSDNALVVYFPELIDPNINRVIGEFVKLFNYDGILDVVPTFHTVHIVFDSLIISVKDLIEYVQETLDKVSSESITKEKDIISIPVCYEEPYAMDLDYVCKVNGLSRDEVIERHTGVDYLIYMIGFTPGFPYLGGMDEKIATPRKTEPRKKLEAGAVGIAGNQTGVYPIDSPGGWQIIGKTPMKLFDPESEQPVKFSAGQYVRFVSISKDAFESYKRCEDEKN